MPKVFEENSSEIEILQIGKFPDEFLVTRKQTAHDDDRLGRVVGTNRSGFLAKAEWRGMPTDLHRKFGTDDEAAQWLLGLMPSERKHSYCCWAERESRITRERMLGHW